MTRPKRPKLKRLMIMIGFMGRRENLGRVPKRPKKGEMVIWDVMGRVPKKQSVPQNLTKSLMILTWDGWDGEIRGSLRKKYQPFCR